MLFCGVAVMMVVCCGVVLNVFDLCSCLLACCVVALLLCRVVVLSLCVFVGLFGWMRV